MGRLSNRVDVTIAGTAATGGSAAVNKAPDASGTVPEAYAKNPEIAKDYKAANPADAPSSLSGNEVGLKVEARNLVRVGGSNFIDASIKGTHKFGDNASAKALHIGGQFRTPLSWFHHGYAFAGAAAGVNSISGGQKNAFAGTALEAALTGGLEMIVADRLPVKVGVGVQRTTGNLGSGASIDTTAFMVFVEGGFSVIENGKPAWRVDAADAGAPPPLTNCETAADAFEIKGDPKTFLNPVASQCKKSPKETFDAAISELKRFPLTPDSLDNYNGYLLKIASELGKVKLTTLGDNTKGLSVDEVSDLMSQVEGLWLATTSKGIATTSPSPQQFFVALAEKKASIGQHLLAAAVQDKTLLSQLARTYDKVLKGAESLPAQENCQVKLDVLKTFYATVFKKNGDPSTQAAYREKADKVLKGLIDAATKEDTKTPGYLAGVLLKLTSEPKFAALLKPNKALLENAANAVSDAGHKAKIQQQIAKITS